MFYSRNSIEGNPSGGDEQYDERHPQRYEELNFFIHLVCTNGEMTVLPHAETYLPAWTPQAGRRIIIEKYVQIN